MAQLYVPTHYPTEFQTNWEHLVQQKESRLSAYVRKETVRGKEKVMPQLDKIAMQAVTSRAATTRQTQQTSAKRWLRHYPYDVAVTFDEWDEMFLGEIVLPTSATMQDFVSAYNRLRDTTIIAALGGTAYTGDTGTTATALGSGQKVAVNFVPPNTTGSNSGLTLGKIIKARSLLGAAEALDNGEMPVLVVTQRQIDDMLNNVTEVKSSDYVNVKALVNGEIDTFMGFKWIRTELLTTIASNVRGCYAYVPSGIVMADGGMKSYMDILPTQSHALQVRAVASVGATRTQEQKVVEIACSEA